MILVLSILKPSAMAFGWWEVDPKRRQRRLKASAAVMTFFILVLGLTTLSFGTSRPDSDQKCKDADADIVGDGVRAATWTQQGILCLIAVSGCFHEAPTAVKEVGAGLLVTHISLAIALMVPLIRGNLSMVDAVLGSMILDSQNAALSVQLSTKETLAARWQVWVVVIGQATGLLASAALIGCFQYNVIKADDNCNCFSAFWWTWFSNCPSSSPNHIYPYWTYLGFRCVLFSQSAYTSLKNTGKFDLAKKREDENPCSKCHYCQFPTQAGSSSETNGSAIEMRPTSPENLQLNGKEEYRCICRSKTCKPCTLCESCRLCKDCGCGRVSLVLTEQDGLVKGLKFSQTLATPSSLCFENGALSLLSMLTAQNLIKVHQINLSSPVYAVGQVATIVIAGGTAIRALWVAGFMFINEVP